MADIFNLTDTWNAGGTTFTAVKMNVTDTASAGASLLLDLRVGGSSKFNVTKGGALTATLGITSSAGSIAAGDAIGFVASSSNAAQLSGGTAPYLRARSEFTIQWSSTGSYAGASDVGLARAAAGILKVTNGSTGAGVIQTPALTVATLPAAATAGKGARSFVSDASTTIILGLGTTVTGGGANNVPVYSDGTNWIYG